MGGRDRHTPGKGRGEATAWNCSEIKTLLFEVKYNRKFQKQVWEMFEEISQKVRRKGRHGKWKGRGKRWRPGGPAPWEGGAAGESASEQTGPCPCGGVVAMPLSSDGVSARGPAQAAETDPPRPPQPPPRQARPEAQARLAGQGRPCQEAARRGSPRPQGPGPSSGRAGRNPVEVQTESDVRPRFLLLVPFANEYEGTLKTVQT